MISQRIEEVMKAFSMNKNQFSKALGITNNVTIGRIINEGRTPSYDILEKIIQTFGSIDANWLMTGEGEMFKKTNNAITASSETAPVYLNDKPVSQEQISKAFSWVIFNNYKSKYDTNIKFDTFDQMSKQFGATASLCDSIQKVMETEIALNMYRFMTDSIKDNKENAIIPDELKDIIDKYDQIYNDFLSESGAMIRIVELTEKHQNTLTDIMVEISNIKNKE